MDHCTGDDLQAGCSLDLGKLGVLQSYSFLDPCVYPPELDMNLELDPYGRWEFRFVSGNQAESRNLGPRIWPLKLHVDFSNPGILSDGHSHLEACLEHMKTGKTTCFLNHTFAMPQCSLPSVFLQSFSVPLIVSLILLLTILISVLTLACVCYRRSLSFRKQYLRHVDENSSRTSSHGSNSDNCFKQLEQGYIDPPLLPQAKGYNSTLKQEEHETSLHELSKSKYYKQYNVHFADEVDCFVQREFEAPESPNSGDSGFSSNRVLGKKVCLTESKQIQTSVNSLDRGYSSPTIAPIEAQVTVI